MRLLLDIVGGLLSYVIVGALLVSALFGGLYFLQFGVVSSAFFLVLLGIVAFVVLRLIRRLASGEDDEQ